MKTLVFTITMVLLSVFAFGQNQSFSDPRSLGKTVKGDKASPYVDESPQAKKMRGLEKAITKGKIKETDFIALDVNDQSSFVIGALEIFSKVAINPGKTDKWFSEKFSQYADSKMSDWLSVSGALIQQRLKEGHTLYVIGVASYDEGEDGPSGINATAAVSRLVMSTFQFGKLADYSMDMVEKGPYVKGVSGKNLYGKGISLFIVDRTAFEGKHLGLNTVLLESIRQLNARYNLNIPANLPTQTPVQEEYLDELAERPAETNVPVAAEPVQAPAPIVAEQPVAQAPAPVQAQPVEEKKASIISLERTFSRLGKGSYSPWNNFYDPLDAGFGFRTTFGTNPVYVEIDKTELAMRSMYYGSLELGIGDEDWLFTFGPTLGYIDVMAFGLKTSLATRLDERSYLVVKAGYEGLNNQEKSMQYSFAAAGIWRSFELSVFTQRIKAGGEYKVNQTPSGYDLLDYSAQASGFGISYYFDFIGSTYLKVGWNHYFKIEINQTKNNTESSDTGNGVGNVNIQFIF